MKINSKRIKDLNVIHESIKLLKEKMGSAKPHDTEFDKDFLNMTPKKHRQHKRKRHKCTVSNFKTSAQQRKQSNE